MLNGRGRDDLADAEFTLQKKYQLSASKEWYIDPYPRFRQKSEPGYFPCLSQDLLLLGCSAYRACDGFQCSNLLMTQEWRGRQVHLSHNALAVTSTAVDSCG